MSRQGEPSSTAWCTRPRTHLTDAQNQSIDTDSQFDLAYGAAHRLASAALRQRGYRSEDRITEFQTLVHTVGTDRADVQIFLKAHNERNLAEKLAAAVGKLEMPKEGFGMPGE